MQIRTYDSPVAKLYIASQKRLPYRDILLRIER